MAVIAQAPLTLAEFSTLPRNGERHELSAGELVTMPPPKFLHSQIATKLLLLLAAALDKSQSSQAFSEAGFVLSRSPLTIRQPDVSVVSTQLARSTGEDDYLEGVSELAVEVVSPWDSAQNLQVKINQYLAAGTKQVWVLYPKTKCVHVYAGGTMRIFDETHALTGGEVVPEFSVKVADLFF